MASRLSCLLLLLPLDDVASCEYTGMVGDLEGRLENLDKLKEEAARLASAEIKVGRL